VVLERLRKTYVDRESAREVAAIRGLDLAIASGELISLLGPSGCGKTTTLRCIAGFETPNAGAIRFDGQDIVARPPEERDIGLVFQNYALFPHMTVRQNVGFGLEMRKVAKAEIQRRVTAVLDMVQLGSYADRYPRQLSGGQQQRVALARALVIEPKVLLLDEPLANLDAKLRDEMRFFIRSLQQRIGITTVYVTHDQAEAMVMSDRVVVMFDGVVCQCATPAEIYERPATRDVANFVGLSNFIAGQAEGGSHQVVKTALGPLHCASGSGFQGGSEALVMVRPENIGLHAERPSGANVFKAEVRERHYLGHTSEFRVACADGSILQVHHNTFMPSAPGDEVWVSLPPERCWLVSPEGRAVA
jgi:putative spermidine/putrescine transport system ATP-binding protein